MPFETLHKVLHPQLKELMKGRRGRVLSTSEIKNIYKRAYPDFNVDWMLPTDHCSNKTNKGACWCAETKDAIFEYLKRATFRVR